MMKFSIKKTDLYYSNRRLKALGIGVNPANKTVTLTQQKFVKLKFKDKKKVDNLIKSGWNIQLSMFYN